MCYAIELDLHRIIAPTPQTGALGGPPRMSQMTQQWALYQVDEPGWMSAGAYKMRLVLDKG